LSEAGVRKKTSSGQARKKKRYISRRGAGHAEKI